jgi:excisionase family DNA binding protein
MPKTGLERAIEEAVTEFTEFIIEAVKDLPLEELSELRGEDLIERPDLVEDVQPEPEPHLEPKAAPAPEYEQETKKKVYPKCVYPGCTKNRFVRGRGYCGKHFRQWRKGKIEDPEVFADQQTDAELLTVKEVAALLEIPEHTIRRLHRLGELPGGSSISPRKTRFDRGLIEKWARSPECQKIKRRHARRAWKGRSRDGGDD